MIRSTFGSVSIMASLASANLAATGPETPKVTAPRVATAERLLRAFGRCLASAAPARARSFLVLQPGSRAEQRVGNDLAANAPDRCARRIPEAAGLKFNATLLRGAMAEELYEQDFKNVPLPAPDPAAQFVAIQPVGENRIKVTSEICAGRLLLQGYARCVARGAPSAVHALGATLPVSPEERAAFLSLRPILSTCLPVSQTFEMGVQQFRSALTEALYLAAVDGTSAALERTH